MGQANRVLVVDDDPDMRDIIQAILEQERIEATIVADGFEALSILAATGADLLLTDIRMPGLDGFELAKRARAVHPDLCVLFMSGYASEYRIDPDRDDFVAKPFQPRQLIGCIFEILHRKSRSEPNPRRRDTKP
jgi:CheY-like chemotaxis protein